MNSCRKCRKKKSFVQRHSIKIFKVQISNWNMLKSFIGFISLSIINYFGSSSCTSECFIFKKPWEFRIFSHAKFYMSRFNYAFLVILTTLPSNFQNFSAQELQSGSHKHWCICAYSLLIAPFSHVSSNPSHWKDQASSGWLCYSFLHSLYLNLNFTQKKDSMFNHYNFSKMLKIDIRKCRKFGKKILKILEKI